MSKDLFNDRISRFSIRKLNVGVCSVLLGTLVMVGTASSVAANESTENPTTVATTEEVGRATPATDTTASATSEVSTSATTYQAEAPVTATETAPTTTAPVEEKAPVVAPVAPAQADQKTEVPAAGVEAPAKEEKVATAPAENNGKRR